MREEASADGALDTDTLIVIHEALRVGTFPLRLGEMPALLGARARLGAALKRALESPEAKGGEALDQRGDGGGLRGDGDAAPDPD
jgi:hypothetical protein